MDDVVYVGVVVVVPLVGAAMRIGSGQLPMALMVLLESTAGAAETTAGAATARVSAPATATEAMIFLNMVFPQCESDSLWKLRGPC